jgi:hypothetical protein
VNQQFRRLLRVPLLTVFAIVAGLAVPAEVAAQGTITTVAGQPTSDPNPGFSGDGGPAVGAKLSAEAYGAVADSAGNVYIADTLNQRIRKVSKATGIITTIAGTGAAGFLGDGAAATSARLSTPLSVAVDASGNVFFSDQNNDRIRKITPGGIISTYAGSGAGNFAGDGGPATSAKLSHPFGVTVDGAGNVYFADTGNHRIRKVTAASGVITTVAGAGGPTGGTGGGTGGYAGDGSPATNSNVRLQNPSFVAVDSSNNIYIADELNNVIRKVTASNGIISTFAGTHVAGYNGENIQANTALLNRPSGVAVDSAGNVYIADYMNFRIRKVTVATNVITSFAGIGTPGKSEENVPAQSSALADPVTVTVDASGVVYIMDQSSFRVRKVTSTAPVTPPATPTGLTVVRSGLNSAQISWNAVSGATNYLLKLSLTAGGPKSMVTNTTTTLVGVPGLTQGQSYYFVVSANNSGGQSADSAEVFFIIPRPLTKPNDIDGDHKADVVIWRPTDGTYYWLTSSSGYSYSAQGNKPWGNAGQGDVPFTGDIDGDGAADLIVWRAATGTWFWLTSSSGYNYAQQGSKAWGNKSLGDVPMLGDMDGDGKVDLVVWRASTGTFFWVTSSSGYTGQGQARLGDQSLGDKPFLADFDGDGKSDLAVWRANTGDWWWLTSSSGYVTQRQVHLGSQSAGDVPLLGDIDGDGKSDLIVWRAPTGTWFWLNSYSGYSTLVNATWGKQSLGDVPLVSDFDGDGRADIAVWRASNGTWFWLTSGSGFAGGFSVQWGSQSQGDKPIVK